jgi:DNA repair exonuclease SbcCD nuclease subunit
MAKRPLRVLHTADLHLGGDGYGDATHGDRERLTFRRIIDCALADRVDLLLIAGDLFDHNTVPDETVAFARAELGRLRQPVVILPGNHDCLRVQGIHARHDFNDATPHVHVIRKLDGEVIEFPELDTIVWGRGMQEHDRSFRPLGYLPPRDEARWCIAMGHGFFYGEGEPPERSSPIFADQIRDGGWDYFALGHHHLRTDVGQGSVAAYYAGEPKDSVLRIDFSVEGGVRVESRALD